MSLAVVGRKFSMAHVMRRRMRTTKTIPNANDNKSIPPSPTATTNKLLNPDYYKFMHRIDVVVLSTRRTNFPPPLFPDVSGGSGGGGPASHII